MTDTTIYNPGNAAHFARIKPVGRRVRVSRHGEVIANSTRGLRVQGTGRDVYDPVIYLPRADVEDMLTPVEDKSTHCPLKGDASYFTHEGDEIAWTYDRPLDGAGALADHVAFYPDMVAIEEIGTHA